MKPVLFSVSYAGYWGQPVLTLEQFIPHAAKLGYKAVMLAGKRPHASPLDMPPERVKRLAALAKKHKVEVACVGAYTHFADGGSLGFPAIELQIAYVETMAKLAKAFGCKLVRVFTAYDEGVDIKKLWETNVKALQECCDRAKAFGVTIAVQNHHDLAVDSESLLEFHADINRANCKLSFDAWSPALRGEDLYAAAKKMAPITAITTNADYVKFPRWHYRPEYTNYERQEPDLVRAVPFGTGFIDYASFFRGLEDGGFDGWANYEMCEKLRGGSSMQNLDRCAKIYLDWLKKR
jgi:sugar phosphate isomerase/epimerase